MACAPPLVSVGEQYNLSWKCKKCPKMCCWCIFSSFIINRMCLVTSHCLTQTNLLSFYTLTWWGKSPHQLSLTHLSFSFILLHPVFPVIFWCVLHRLVSHLSCSSRFDRLRCFELFQTLWLTAHRAQCSVFRWVAELTPPPPIGKLGSALIWRWSHRCFDVYLSPSQQRPYHIPLDEGR